MRERPLQSALAIGLAIGFAVTLALAAGGLSLTSAALAGAFFLIIGTGVGLLVLWLIDGIDRRRER